MQNKIRIPKVLYPFDINEKEKKEMDKLIEAAFRRCSIEEAMRLANIKLKKAKHHHTDGHRHY